MTFEEILDQAIAMLQRRGRLTYGTLRRQFQLDDAVLDDLKEQLLYAHPQVVDDAGRGLVWTGETGRSPTTTPLTPLFSLQVPEDRYPSLKVSPQRQRHKTLKSLVTILLELAEREPVLFILEDLHWTDPTTLEFLGLLVEHVPAAALYTVLTCRPHFHPAWHHRSYLTEITVNQLSQYQIAWVAEHVAGGKNLPAEVLQQIVEKTDKHALIQDTAYESL
jgi:predicted ATPase